MSGGLQKEEQALQKLLGHRFSEPEWLRQAITHKSVGDGQPTVGSASYERLEFLGDRVLGLIIADYLFRTYPDEQEGTLARRLNNLVSGKTCAEIARELGLQTYLVAEKGANGKVQTQGMLADVCEAVIAAIYLDGGISAASKFVLAAWDRRLSEAQAPSRDPKTALQEWTQSKGLKVPHYVLVGRSGPDHAPQFSVAVEVEGYQLRQASGASKRAAQQSAAADFLRTQNITDEGQTFD
jgi:ribonuclease-3